MGATQKTHLISASCIQEMGRLVESPKGSNSALPAGRSARPSTASTNGTDGDFLIVHFAGAAAAGFTEVAVESEDEKERTGRAALTKANILNVRKCAGMARTLRRSVRASARCSHEVCLLRCTYRDSKTRMGFEPANSSQDHNPVQITELRVQQPHEWPPRLRLFEKISRRTPKLAHEI